MKRVASQYFIFLFFIFFMFSCSTLYLENIEGLSKDSKYIKFIFGKNKVSLRHYFTISGKLNLRYKEPLFLKVGNNIVASFLLERYRRIGDKYIQAFFSVGKDISLKTYLECIKARKFLIINSSGTIIKTVVFSKLPDSEDILHQNSKIV
ncbi:hypothetical protein DB313_05885 (plasmid) [Borrelia turcica IST7]|uniref:Lipoprotein n=1 Tax=Borrelia turcica IST7 TaxID=1104446 RepID=A0A386PPF6_9SPIR|nr:hypothetical protein [Borrelia turcica]AYE37028.1 hypothetical protein DB313_05885 [Borrelia turcica IST7]